MPQHSLVVVVVGRIIPRRDFPLRKGVGDARVPEPAGDELARGAQGVPGAGGEADVEGDVGFRGQGDGVEGGDEEAGGCGGVRRRRRWRWRWGVRRVLVLGLRCRRRRRRSRRRSEPRRRVGRYDDCEGVGGGTHQVADFGGDCRFGQLCVFSSSSIRYHHGKVLDAGNGVGLLLHTVRPGLGGWFAVVMGGFFGGWVVVVRGVLFQVSGGVEAGGVGRGEAAEKAEGGGEVMTRGHGGIGGEVDGGGGIISWCSRGRGLLEDTVGK